LAAEAVMQFFSANDVANRKVPGIDWVQGDLVELDGFEQAVDVLSWKELFYEDADYPISYVGAIRQLLVCLFAQATERVMFS
jgi:hypothetical protein